VGANATQVIRHSCRSNPTSTPSEDVHGADVYNESPDQVLRVAASQSVTEASEMLDTKPWLESTRIRVATILWMMHLETVRVESRYSQQYASVTI